MRPARISETIPALAGGVLVVLVFLPWWTFDASSVDAAPALRGLRLAALGSALVSLTIAVVRLATPPLHDYDPVAVAYAGTAAIAIVAICAAAGLRRT